MIADDLAAADRNDRRLLIVGGSVRAAAQSARRAGYEVVTADRFADRDLVAGAGSFRLSELARSELSRPPAEDRPPAAGPHAQAAGRRALRQSPLTLALHRLAAIVPSLEWMYTGGLENHPELIAWLAARMPLAGNDGPVVRPLRDPFELARLWRAHQLPHPRVLRQPPTAAQRGRWLRKPLASCGGSHIDWADRRSNRRNEPARGGWYYQQFIAGTSHSAVFLAAAGHCCLLGVTRQLVGRPWASAAPFAYCGSIGPLHLSLTARQVWARIGRLLAREFPLSGLFGVDAVVTADQQVWPVEVNPRFPASAEVIERAWDESLVALHLQATGWARLPADRGDAAHVVGKAVLFAPRPTTFCDALARYAERLNQLGGDTALADIPWTEQPIPAGHPLLTILVRGTNAGQVEARLRARATELLHYLR